MSIRLIEIGQGERSLGTAEAITDPCSIVAIAHQGWNLTGDDLQAAVNEFVKTESDVGIVPLGDRGELLWDGLPGPLGLLAAQPGETAVILLRDNSLSCTGNDLWKRLVSTEEDSIQRLAGIDRPVDSGPALLHLAPGQARTPGWLGAEISRVCQSADQVEGLALQAGIWQLHDELDRSHECSQQIEGRGKHRAGDYWHAIMHRREPDYGNSKYWFRRVGQHPLMTELRGLARSISNTSKDPEVVNWSKRICGSGWEPLVFVDLCEAAAENEDSPLGIFARRIQLGEMHLLLQATAADAGILS